MESEPLVIQATRGDVVENRHLVHAAVVDLDGQVIASFGETDVTVPCRSAAKPLQVQALIRSGAAERFALGEEHIALASGSHNGEDRHVDLVEAWLARLELDEGALGCGPSLPYTPELAEAYLRAGRPTRRAVHPCSGQHAGFLSVAQHLGYDPAEYLTPTGQVQRLVFEAVSDACGIRLEPDGAAGDGCGAPVVSLPLYALARGIARLARPGGGETDVVAAVSASAWCIAGAGRIDTRITEALRGSGICKFGADGVFVAVARGAGLALALKVADGSTIASETAVVHLLCSFGALDPADFADLVERARLDSNGRPVGTVTVEPGRSARDRRR